MKTRETIQNLIPYSAGVKVPGAIKLSSNENPLGTSPKATQAMKQYLDQSFIYPDGAYSELRTRLSQHLGTQNDNLIIGNGSDEIITLLGLTYLTPNDEVILAKETFSEYLFATKIMGATPIQVPLKEGYHDLEAMEASITSSTKMIFICNPNNPTGTYWPEKDILKFLDKVPSEVLVVLDEAYNEYVRAEDYPHSVNLLNKYNNLIILRTFSKIYGLAALRVGYGISNKDIIQDIWKAKQPFNVGTLGQVAAKAALDDRDFVIQSFQSNKTGLAQLEEGLTSLGLFYYPTQANFICVNVNQDSKKIFDRMLKAGVTIRSLISFGMPEWIRITIGTEKQNLAVLKALKESLI
ncbi:histidinol-phosphate transaminase [Spirochaeta cellobiosiphila]|uniref:histidinol-phosphate transaminase n=1 Tax=Spirochaeta cellobiosiphila TaxID=504483 RepID=UPI000416DBB1|nr:histidinol-phosphate transaminase [Spirochaeta cellobiosiphila]